MKSHSELERGILALWTMTCAQNCGVVTLKREVGVESQRSAEPMRIRKEVRMELVEREG